MRRVQTLEDVQIVLNELLNWKAQQDTRLFDMHGRRIANLGEAQLGSDAVTLEQVNKLIREALARA